jgi:haloalkane dehalogenase
MVSPLFPFVGRFLDLGDARMHYLDEGSGPPVFLLHGNPTWSFFYRNLIPALRGNHRVIAPDHVGCGMSDKPGASRYSTPIGENRPRTGFLLRNSLDRHPDDTSGTN